jgi:hypothetical protein
VKEDPIRAYLRESGCGSHLIEGGLPGLIEKWNAVTQSVENGYALGLDDYLNDMDTRQLIEEALEVATPDQHLEAADEIARLDQLMHSLTKPAGGCLWGAEVAEEEGWNVNQNWWYFSRPIRGNEDLDAEIDAAI